MILSGAPAAVNEKCFVLFRFRVTEKCWGESKLTVGVMWRGFTYDGQQMIVLGLDGDL